MQPLARREFLGIALATMPLARLRVEAPGTPSLQSTRDTDPVYVRAGSDRDGVHKTLGISTIDFKVTSADTGGAMLAIENTNRGKGGPAKHMHPAQDELFCVIDGEYIIVIGDQRFDLKPGDTHPGAARCAARLGIRRERGRADADHLHTTGCDGRLLPPRLERQLDAGAGSCALACARHGVARAAAVGVARVPQARCRRRTSGARNGTAGLVTN